MGAEREPAEATEETWRYVFRAMTQHFKDRSAASITPDEAQQWINGLKNPKRKARTVKKNWINASKTVFGWAVEHKLIQRNPFANEQSRFQSRSNSARRKRSDPKSGGQFLRPLLKFLTPTRLTMQRGAGFRGFVPTPERAWER